MNSRQLPSLPSIMNIFFPRSLYTLVLASLAKPGVAENRKKPRQLFKSIVFSKDEDDKEPRRLLAHLASRVNKAKEVHPRTTAMDETEAVTNAESKPQTRNVDAGILASSRRNLEVSDDFPSGRQRKPFLGTLHDDEQLESTSASIESIATEFTSEAKVCQEDSEECDVGYECICECDDKPTSACDIDCTVNTLADLKEAIKSAPDIPNERGLISVCSGTFNFTERIELDNKAFDMCCPGPEKCIFDGGKSTEFFKALNSPVNFKVESFTFQNGNATPTDNYIYVGGGAINLFYVTGNVEFISNEFSNNYAVRLCRQKLQSSNVSFLVYSLKVAAICFLRSE
jgi:hypothetical protein